MTTASPPSETPLESAPITSIQPGGGFGFALERLWGNIRRWYLRTCRPDYVERMAQLRQGTCPDCPHEIIDSRDLKLYQNVCGYWFEEAEDPYQWRNRLGLARPGLVEILLFSVVLLGAAVGSAYLAVDWSAYFYIPAGVSLVLWFFVLSFFRDPERNTPTDSNLLVSPADGKITHLERIDDPDFPNGEAYRISIFLSVFNVHINRIPRTGVITELRYFPGEYLDARHADCAVRNEQFWIDMRDGQTGSLLRIKQVAGAIARRIVCVLKADQKVTVGDRLGMIKFGSRTDILLPEENVGEVLVKVGQSVKGASTPLLRVHSSESNSDG